NVVTVTPWTADGLPPYPSAVLCEIDTLDPPVGHEADQVKVQVSVIDPAQGANESVTLVRLTSNTSVVSGTALGTPVASGSIWVFSRPGFKLGVAEAEFTAASDNGTDNDTVTIPEQGRDTLGLLVRAEVTTTTPTAVTVRVRVADPFPQGAGSVTISYTQT